MKSPRSRHDTIRTGTSAEAIAEALTDNLHFLHARLPRHATPNDWYMALASTIRDHVLDRYITTLDALTGVNTAKVVAYFSAEFLTGPHLGNSLVCLGLWDAARQAVSSVGQDLHRVPDPRRPVDVVHQRLGPTHAGAGPGGEEETLGVQRTNAWS